MKTKPDTDAITYPKPLKPTNRKRVGIDVDGVLALLYDVLIAEYNALHKTSYTIDAFSSWNKWEIPLTFSEFMGMYNEIWTKRWTDVKPSIPESALLPLLKRYDVDLLTHRPKGHEPYLRNWLGLYFPNIHGQLKIRITDSPEAKVLHDHDFMFDDAPPLAEELIRLGEAKPLLFLITQPWNRNEDYEKRSSAIRRVKNLKEGIGLLLKMAPDAEPQTNK